MRQRTCAYSDGFVYDNTPPTTPTLCVTTGDATTRNLDVDDCDATGRWLSTRDQVAIVWRGCDDQQSGAYSFSWSLSDAATPLATANVRALEDVGRYRQVGATCT